MASTAMRVADPALVRLDWECEHFGLIVAQLAQPELNDAALEAALRLAREQGVRLLVWPAANGRDVPRKLLDEFAGALVDRKASFSRPLPPAIANDDAVGFVAPRVISYAGPTASAALVELAISAGVFSRFQVDPHFSHEKFVAMYRRWIERSVARELADVVLAVPLIDHNDALDEPLAGMITLSETDGVASIGLIAVAAAARRMGIGGTLMRAAHGWMVDRGAREARVVTQLVNLPACRLYERSGYRLARVQPIYHFWL